MEQNRREFFQQYGIPGVVGVIDCTHVAIIPPNKEDPVYPEHLYVNRKHYHSINVQLVCDSHMKILNVNARFPGSCHDAHIWSRSRVRENMVRLVREGNSCFLIGDSGYPLRPWLLIPFRNPNRNTPEHRFNQAFTRARSVIERCNGLLKMRFRCLLKDRVLHYSPTKASKIINSCVVLHNMCIAANMPLPVDEDFEQNYDLDPAGHFLHDEGRNADLIAGQELRHRIANNYFAIE